MKTTTASAKFKYAPFDALYFEGGYQWQEAIRSRDSTSKFVVPSAFLKAQSEFQTGFISHNISASLNGYQWKSGANSSLLGDMKNVGLLYDIGFGEHFEVILSGANSWFKNTNYNKSGLSYAGSLMYKIIPSTLNVYFTYADSLKEGNSHFYDPATYIGHPLAGQTFWLMGSLARTGGYENLTVLFIVVCVALIPLFLLRYKLNALCFGEEEARAMGLNVKV